MNTIQTKIQQELGVKTTINHQEEIRTRVNFLKEYLLKTGMKGFVLGISGGQDSTLAGKLAQLAVEELKKDTGNVYQFVAVRLPYAIQKDEADAQRALQFIQPDKTYVYNVQDAVNEAMDEYEHATGEKLKDFHKGNIKARMRMIVQYAIGGQKNLLVIGTDHAAEAVTGFFTKYGDGGADILPLSGLTKRQGKALLKELGADEPLYLKVPTADLLDNVPQQADETELGITYDQLDDYLEGKDVPQEVVQKIETRFMMTQHKRTVPVTPFDTWWK